MANGEARHHHYLSQCYLRNFGTGAGKQRRIQVANLAGSNWFESGPRNIGGVRDFNRIEIEGKDPNELEKMLAEFEGRVAESIRAVETSRAFEGSARITILNFVAMLAVRGPKQRDHWKSYMDLLVRRVMDVALATKEQWEAQQEEIKKAGKEVKEEITYEQVKAFHDGGQYEIAVSREYQIGQEFKGFEALVPIIVGRNWRLYTTNEERGLFVTTDRPVNLYWKREHEVPAFARPHPGFGLRQTNLYFPITRELAIVGAFEDLDEGTQEADLPFIAEMNARMINRAYAQVYSAKRTIPYFAQGHVCHDAHFMDRFMEMKKIQEAAKP